MSTGCGLPGRLCYRGTYEGGLWASFDVEDWNEVPREAFGGDVTASAWWWDSPPIFVAVGDSAAEAERQARQCSWEQPEFEVGTSVRIAICAPSDYAPGEHGEIVTQSHDRSEGYDGSPIPGQ